jgi:hypothetical protein
MFSPTLKFANILNAGTVHEGTPSSDFSIFDPLHAFFGIYFAKLESTILILPRGPYSGQSLNGKGEFDFEGGPTNHTIGARFFHYGLSRI